jgi:predicted NUDIX family phosphoesterase
MQQQRAHKPLPPRKKDEKILVVKRTELLADTTWNGLKKDNPKHYLTIINNKKQFLWRSHMEEDETYKQIIPYLVFEYNNTYFLMQRTATASEKRLQNKYSLGIGGHIREEDITNNNLFDWAKREFHEEVNYNGNLTIKPLGILNDDSNAVGRVHIGFVLLLTGDSDKISVKSELKSGTLTPLKQCANQYDKMESWSQMVFDCLSNQKK